MTTHYNLENIRALLIEGFSEAELRSFCFDRRDFRSVHNQLSESTGKSQIVHWLVAHADRKELFSPLLTWAEERNPAKYKKFQPYYSPQRKVRGESQDLKETIDLDPTDEQTQADSEMAIGERNLQVRRQQLLNCIDEEDWIAAEEKIKQIENTHPNYDEISSLKIKVQNNKRWTALYSDLERYIKEKKWDDALETANKLIKDFSKHESGAYKDVYKLLRKAEKSKKRKLLFEKVIKFSQSLIIAGQTWINSKQNQASAYLSPLEDNRSQSQNTKSKRILAIIGGIVIGIIANTTYDSVIVPLAPNWPNPFSVDVATIDRYEVFLDNVQVMNNTRDKLDSAPLLSSIGGEPVKIRVDAFGKNDVNYKFGEIECTWIVIPVYSGEEFENTRACETYYMPPKNGVKQEVRVEVKAIQHQVKPDTISLQFNIK